MSLRITEKDVKIGYFHILPEYELEGAADKIDKAFTNLDTDELAPLNKGEDLIDIFYVEDVNDDCICGALVNCQMNGAPFSYDPSKRKLNQVSLDPNVGLAHPACFLFDKKRRVLIIESTKSGPSPKDWCLLFASSLAIPSIIASPIMLANTEEVFTKMEYVTRFSYRITNLRNPSLFTELTDKVSVDQAIELARNSNSETVICTLSVPLARKNKRGRRNGQQSLKKGFIRSWFDKFTAMSHNASGNIERMEAHGLTDDNEFVLLDLIRNRLMDTFKIENSPRDPSFVSEMLIRQHFEHIQASYNKKSIHLDGLLNLA